MQQNASGTLAYAGLSVEALLSHAKAAFVQAQPPVPERFGTFLPLFPVELIQDMEYIGPVYARGARVAPNGFSIDPVEYFAKLYTRSPELCAGDNALRNFTYEGRYVGRGVFTVDSVWAERFPQYRPFMGEKLMVYLIGGGSQAVAVPESVYPRGCGVLRAAEEKMQAVQRVGDYLRYVRGRTAAGGHYDAKAFAADYLEENHLAPVSFTQRDLERVMQDLSVVKSLQSDTAGVGHFTQNARRAGRVNQYAPMRYACDRFAVSQADKRTAWLAQLYWRDDDYISDLWIPYPDFFACVDKRTMALDARRLCRAFQIAPRYDPETGGGSYPDTVRVASVRDHGFEMLTGETRNNPAYGDGIAPEGGVCIQVFIVDSAEMIRQRKLAPEKASLAVENRAVPPEEYGRMMTLAVLQEHKGRLIDAMYRCETVLKQIDHGAPVYDQARRLLVQRADKLDAAVTREAEAAGEVLPSGYDEDIAYLRRMRAARESTQAGEPATFVPDTIREESIEGGYAMRAGLLRMPYANAALPESPDHQTVGADDSEDGESEPLPLITDDEDQAPSCEEETPQPDENGVPAPDGAGDRATGTQEQTQTAPQPSGVAEPMKTTDLSQGKNAADSAEAVDHDGDEAAPDAPPPNAEEQQRISGPDATDGIEATPPTASGYDEGRKTNPENPPPTPRRKPITMRELTGLSETKTDAHPADGRMADFLKKHGG